MLEALLNELRNFHRDYEKIDGRGRSQIIKDQAEFACAFARKNGILGEPDYSFDELKSAGNIVLGSEHLVDLDQDSSLIIKITVPDGFGLTPALKTHRQAHTDLRDEISSYRHSIEFVPATPLEYLTRWQACKELFNDDVQLLWVIKWPDRLVSFVISQPQYNGTIPTHEKIEEIFTRAGWKRIPNKLGHGIYYNYAYEILALDIEPRNCFVSSEDTLLPFDVILSAPDEELEDFLGLY